MISWIEKGPSDWIGSDPKRVSLVTEIRNKAEPTRLARDSRARGSNVSLRLGTGRRE